MKKRWACLMIAFSLMVLLPPKGWAEEEKNVPEQGEEQTPNEVRAAADKGKKTVTYRLEGDEAIVTGAVDPDLKRIVIPSVTKIEGRYYAVTAVESEAFKGMKELRTVIVGSCIESIGEGAFDDCPNLETLFFKGEDPRKE